MRLCLY